MKMDPNLTRSKGRATIAIRLMAGHEFNDTRMLLESLKRGDRSKTRLILPKKRYFLQNAIKYSQFAMFYRKSHISLFFCKEC